MDLRSTESLQSLVEFILGKGNKVRHLPWMRQFDTQTQAGRTIPVNTNGSAGVVKVHICRGNVGELTHGNLSSPHHFDDLEELMGAEQGVVPQMGMRNRVGRRTLSAVNGTSDSVQPMPASGA
jgi:hypothetical protein